MKLVSIGQSVPHSGWHLARKRVYRRQPAFFLWDTLCGCVAETFRFTPAEKKRFAQNKTAQLIAAIPFAAGCDEPERTALAHLAVYMTELRGGRVIGGHTSQDNESPFTRLRLLASFKGGNQAVIEHGLTKLALIMLDGYIRSKAEDALRCVYNPLNDGAWDAEKTRQDLTHTLEAFPCKVLDAIIPDDTGEPGAW